MSHSSRPHWRVPFSETPENLHTALVRDSSSSSGVGLLRKLTLMSRPTGGEELRQWQEEEFQRKLRGEYEAAQRRIGEVVSRSYPLLLQSWSNRSYNTCSGNGIPGSPAPSLFHPYRQPPKNHPIQLPLLAPQPVHLAHPAILHHALVAQSLRLVWSRGCNASENAA